MHRYPTQFILKVITPACLILSACGGGSSNDATSIEGMWSGTVTVFQSQSFSGNDLLVGEEMELMHSISGSDERTVLTDQDGHNLTGKIQ